MRILSAAVAFLFFLQAPSEPAGTVAGVVVSVGTGKPIPGAAVKLSVVNLESGLRSPKPVTTDSNGRFVAVDLAPGAYTLEAAKGGYVTQFYGSRRTGMAGLADFSDYGEKPMDPVGVVLVEAGKASREVVIKLTPSGTVSGRVFGLNGEPLVGLQVELLRNEFDARGRRTLGAVVSRATNDRGEYRFFDFSPGRYYLRVRWMPMAMVKSGEVVSGVTLVDARNSNGQQYAAAYYPGFPDLEHASIIDVFPGAEHLGINVNLRLAVWMAARAGTRPLDVAEGEQDVVVLTLAPAATISGRAMLDGEPWTTPSFETFKIQLEPDPAVVDFADQWPGPSLALTPDGTFTITNVEPEEYRLRFTGLPADAYVREARYGGTDVLTEKFSFDNVRSGSLQIAISTKSGQITGRIVDANGRPADNFEAVLIPEAPVRLPDRYKTAKTDVNGRFTIHGIAPGDYKLYSWENIARYGYFDPDFVRPFEGKGLSIHIDEGSRLTVNLSLLEAPQ
jgi:hypothetical protein